MTNHQNQAANEKLRLYGFISRSRLGSLLKEVFDLASIVGVSGQNIMACGVKKSHMGGVAILSGLILPNALHLHLLHQDPEVSKWSP